MITKYPRPPCAHGPFNTFQTERLQLAVYLHASERLHLLGIDRTAPRKVRFVFKDPSHVGEQLELEF
jgi:hypothetical protein